MSGQRNNNIYSDIRTDFINHPVTGVLQMVYNEDAVKQSIKSLLLTGPYERHWNPDYGAGLAKYLFEPISQITEESIKQAIINAVETYEKRAELVDVYVSAKPDQNGYTATIVFYVRNIAQPITLSVLLQRIR